MNYLLLLSVFAGIASLLILVLYFKFPAFIALLIASIVTGLLAGLSAAALFLYIRFHLLTKSLILKEEKNK